MLALLMLTAITHATAPVFGTQADLACCVCAVDLLGSGGDGITSPGDAPTVLRPALSCRELPFDQSDAFSSRCEELGASSLCFKEIMATEELIEHESGPSCVETIAEFGFACPTNGAPALSGTGMALLLGGLTALGVAAVRQRSRRRV